MRRSLPTVSSAGAETSCRSRNDGSRRTKRPSRLHVRATMAGTDVTEVKVGGGSVGVGEGSMAV